MRRTVVWLTVVLLVVGGGVLGDNLLRGYVEARVAEAVAAELGSGDPPSVSLGGLPFSMALLTRSVPEAHVALDAMPLEIAGHDVRLTAVDATTGEIRLDGETVRVATLAGSGTLGYDDLATVAEVPVTYAGEGRLELRYTSEIFGRRLSFAVSAVPSLDVPEQVIRLTEPKLDLAGNAIDLGLTQAQLDAIIKPIDVHLEHRLRLTSLVPEAGGVRVGVGGEGLTAPVR